MRDAAVGVANVENIPVASPEIELPVLGRAAPGRALAERGFRSAEQQYSAEQRPQSQRRLSFRGLRVRVTCADIAFHWLPTRR